MWEIIQCVWKIGKRFHDFWTRYDNSDHSVQSAVHIMIRQTYAFAKIRWVVRRDSPFKIRQARPCVFIYLDYQLSVSETIENFEY